jgi:hypothetical protein
MIVANYYGCPSRKLRLGGLQPEPARQTRGERERLRLRDFIHPRTLDLIAWKAVNLQNRDIMKRMNARKRYLRRLEAKQPLK